VSLILVVLAVGHAIRTEYLCSQIPDRPFQVVCCGFDGAPHCVALKLLESTERSAMAKPPTVRVDALLCRATDTPSVAAHVPQRGVWR